MSQLLQASAMNNSLCRVTKFLAFVFFLFAPTVAGADCSIPSQALAADDRLAPQCKELGEFTIMTPEGERRVTMVRDQAVLASEADQLANWTQSTIQQSASALMRIGAGDVHNLTMVVSGVTRDLPPAPFVGGRTHVNNEAGECIIVIFPKAVSKELLRLTTAHEFFHCVQYRVASAQMRNFLRDEDWWVEGAAEWFANYANPGTRFSTGLIGEFDSNAVTSPIIDFGYEAFVFFSWFAKEVGEIEIVDILDEMPIVDNNRTQQEIAAISLLAPEQWRNFVEDYADKKIEFPDGAIMESYPEVQETYIWTDSESVLIGELAAKIEHSVLVFSCGEWTINVEKESGVIGFRETTEIEWGDLPETLTVDPDEEKRFYTAGFGSDIEGLSVTITAEQESNDGCRCQTHPEPGDTSCLSGLWRLQEGGVRERLHEIYQATIGPDYDWFETTIDTAAPGLELELSSTGELVYSDNNSTETLRGKKGDYREIRVEITSQAGGVGRWSAENNELSVCMISEPSGAEVIITTIDRGTTDVIDMSPQNYWSDHLTTDGYIYECEGDTLTIRHATGVEWRYGRLK